VDDQRPGSDKQASGEPTGKTSPSRLRPLRNKLFGKRSRKSIISVASGIVVAVAAGIILEVTQPWITSQPSETVVNTQVIFYEPWDTSNPYGNTLSNVHVVHTFTGYCWEQSLVTNRADAYRCVSPAHNRLYDPCFASPFLISSNVTPDRVPRSQPRFHHSFAANPAATESKDSDL
jgi:hypothetical protein